MSVETRMDQELKSIIQQAINKVNANNENELSRYLHHDDSRMHHFTFQRLKTNSPDELAEIIRSQIMETEHPRHAPVKPRKPRESKTPAFRFTREQASQIRNILSENGYHNLAELFTPFQSKQELKKQVIKGIRKDQIDKSLLDQYLRMLDSMK